MSHAIRGLSGYYGFSMGQKNLNEEEDIEFLHPDNFRQSPFGGYRGGNNVSGKQRPRPS